MLHANNIDLVLLQRVTASPVVLFKVKFVGCFTQVGKALEPSVFWINQCEDLYLKKKNKNDLAKPHKWAKILNKTLKVCIHQINWIPFFHAI